MRSCKPLYHKLVTNNDDKFATSKSENYPKIELDVSVAGLFEYSFEGGGPNTNIHSGTRSIRSCNPLSITSSEPIVKQQSAMIEDSKIRFNVPNYSETDKNCPAV